MDTSHITRSYLETLSTVSLLEMADSYEIDIPENLNRQFIMGELLEAIADEVTDKSGLVESDEISTTAVLAKSYNETKISIVMQNPVWCCVYWDFKKKEFNAFVKDENFIGFSIIFMFYVGKDDDTPADTFEVPVSEKDRIRFVLMQHPGFYTRVALVAKKSNTKVQFLVESELIVLPSGLPDLSSKTLNKTVSPILKISGLPEILLSQYVQHRQSFS